MRTKDWLIKKRTHYDLTQKQLANEIDISPYTIENIEQGKWLGSADTWEKIENYFEEDNSVSVSYDSDKLIEEIENDISEFGENYSCILFYKTYNDYIIFTDYTFNCEEDPFNPNKELHEGEHYIETTLKYAHDIFKSQNKII